MTEKVGKARLVFKTCLTIFFWRALHSTQLSCYFFFQWIQIAISAVLKEFEIYNMFFDCTIKTDNSFHIYLYKFKKIFYSTYHFMFNHRNIIPATIYGSPISYICMAMNKFLICCFRIYHRRNPTTKNTNFSVPFPGPPLDGSSWYWHLCIHYMFPPNSIDRFVGLQHLEIAKG